MVLFCFVVFRVIVLVFLVVVVVVVVVIVVVFVVVAVTLLPQFDQTIIDDAIEQWRKRLRVSDYAEGGHIEHMM